MEKRESWAAEAAAAIPDSVREATKATCTADLERKADASTGQREHTLESVEFEGEVSEYNIRHKPLAHEVNVRYILQMVSSGDTLKYLEKCRVRADGQGIDWLPA
ncbi:hypothetical protein [Arthrobacter sp. NPDC089319]|uniref:hypothetical protein n=1 Tax=Arthrobacter sp. NPDC089319 TaxID=3155915 RepID=UPI00342694F6